MTFQDYLKEINACTDAREWATGKDFKDIYNTCHRGDWLCWRYARTNPSDIRGLTLVKGLQANEICHLMQDPRSLAAVDAAIAYGRGQINEKQLLAAAVAAVAAAAYVNNVYAKSLRRSADIFRENIPYEKINRVWEIM